MVFSQFCWLRLSLRTAEIVPTLSALGWSPIVVIAMYILSTELLEMGLFLAFMDYHSVFVTRPGSCVWPFLVVGRRRWLD